MKEFLKSGKMIVSAVLAALGAIAATIAILQFTQSEPNEIWLLNEDGAQLHITQSQGPLEGVYRADEIIVADEVVAEGDVALIANIVQFKEGAVLLAPTHNVTLIATRVELGTIDTSGADAEEMSADGSSAGTVMVVAAQVNGSQFIARGGNGAMGASGAAGAPGENLNCEDFTDLANKPNDGLPGERGSNGGAGGAGGMVSVFGHAGLISSTARVDGGRAGMGGLGGAGGKGGKGCSVFGRALEVGEAGIDGLAGANGKAGPEGRAESVHIDFGEASKLLKRELKSPPSIPMAARQLAKRAVEIGVGD